MAMSQHEKKMRAKADNLYKSVAENKNLSPDVHDALAFIAHQRHNIHSHGEPIFHRLGTGAQMEKDLFSKLMAVYVSGEISPEIINPALIRDVKFCFAQMSNAGNKAKDIDDPVRYDECIREFTNAKEELNEKLTVMLAAIDAEYGTRYKPSGKHPEGYDPYGLTKAGIYRTKETLEQKQKEYIKEQGRTKQSQKQQKQQKNKNKGHPKRYRENDYDDYDDR